MRVLNVNFSIDSETGGGTAERTYQLSSFLSKKQMHCRVLTLDFGPLNEKLLNGLRNCEVVTVPCLMRRFFVPRVSMQRLKALVADVDMIHLIGHWSMLNALVYLWARKLNKPYVFCPAGALAIYGRSKTIKKLYNWFVGNSIVKNADGFIAITADEAKFFEKNGIDPNKITLIPNGVSADDFIIQPQVDVLPALHLAEKKYLLFLGRLNAIKGPDLLLEAFANIAANFPEFHLIYAGPDDGMLGQLQCRVAELNLQQRVHFAGFVSGQAKAQVYHHATLLVIPSRHEAMSIVVLEGGILAKPVLMTDQCGFPELVAMGGGEIVAASIAGIESGLRKLLENPNLPAMGERLKEHVLKNYSWDIQVDKLIAWYQKILAARDRK
jgi:glycosyltransferase involved in cell wall biosynthesis